MNISQSQYHAAAMINSTQSTSQLYLAPPLPILNTMYVCASVWFSNLWTWCVCVCVCARACVHVCACARACACVCVCVCACACMHMHTLMSINPRLLAWSIELKVVSEAIKDDIHQAANQVMVKRLSSNMWPQVTISWYFRWTAVIWRYGRKNNTCISKKM